jgi:hypothetical protein
VRGKRKIIVADQESGADEQAHHRLQGRLRTIAGKLTLRDFA